VVKVGGAIIRDAGILADVLASVTTLAGRRPILVVPGGGEFADQVRSAQQRIAFSDDAAHWMALLAMDQAAELLADRLPHARVVDDGAGANAALAVGLCPVLAPSRWMRAADVLPHSWDVTSDSVAAFVAGAIDAVELVLVKRRDGPLDDLVDGALRAVMPRHLPVRAVTPAGLRALAAR
jgi:aspartokinase-like uncharacterized kinase